MQKDGHNTNPTEIQGNPIDDFQRYSSGPHTILGQLSIKILLAIFSNLVENMHYEVLFP